MINKQIVIGPATLAYLKNVIDMGEFSQELIYDGRVRRAADRMRSLIAAFEKDEINPLVW